MVLLGKNRAGGSCPVGTTEGTLVTAWQGQKQVWQEAASEVVP